MIGQILQGLALFPARSVRSISALKFELIYQGSTKRTFIYQHVPVSLHNLTSHSAILYLLLSTTVSVNAPVLPGST
jgi:hypothetical protein